MVARENAGRSRLCAAIDRVVVTHDSPHPRRRLRSARERTAPELLP